MIFILIEKEINFSDLQKPSFSPYVTNRNTNLINSNPAIYEENFSITLLRNSVGKSNIDLVTQSTTEKFQLIDVQNGKIEIGIFNSKTIQKKPVILFIHGGGFVAGNFFQYRNQCRLMAEKSNAIVIACNYRLAPENPFPTGLNDCQEVYQWILDNAINLNIDTNKIYLVGDSAGAGLAISMCLKEKLLVKRIFNIYGCVDILPTSNENYVWDYNQFPIIEEQKPLLIKKLEKFYHQLNLFVGVYLQNNEDFSQSDISPIYATDFCNLPPMIYFEAEFDYFKPSNRYMCEILKKVVDVTIYSYRGMDHGFFESLGYTPEAEHIIQTIAKVIRDNS